MTRDTSSEQSRLFRTLVLMSGSLAIGCGGLGDESPTHVTGSGGTSSTGATGGVGSSTGGATSSGGAPSTGGITVSGGSTSTGGNTPLPGVGGYTYVTPGPFECPPEQWSCSDRSGHCPYNPPLETTGEALPTGCACDPEKPLTAADCGADEVFVCHMAVQDEQGRLFREGVPFACECGPATAGCGDVCSQCYEIETAGAAGSGSASLVCDCFFAPILK